MHDVFLARLPALPKKLKVRDELVGHTARCPHCRGAITVQRPQAPDAAEEPEEEEEESGGAFDFSIPSKPAAAPASAGSPVAGKQPPRPGATAAAKDPAAKSPAANDPTVDPAAKQASAKKPSRAALADSAGIAAYSVSANTDVSVLLYLVGGIIGTAVFYALAYPFSYRGGKLTYVGRLFIGASSMADGGWVPIAEVFLFCWAIGMLIAKYFKIRRQQRALLFDVLPAEVGDTITVANLDRFLEGIAQLPKTAAGTFLVTRCVRGLEHFRARRSAADTATMLSSQSDLDASSVDSSYTMFHVFIWAIPILGFLGTVIGVSAAVGGFTGTLDNSSDIGALKEGLKSITSGLGTAFDTTLVALSMAMILTFPVSALQKLEGDVIGQVDEYTNEYLLRRLEDGRGGPDRAESGASRGEMQHAVETALATHRAELESWSQQLKSLGTTIAGDLHESWRRIDEQQAARVAQTEAALGQFVGQMGGLGEQISRQVEAGWEVVNARVAEGQVRVAQTQADQVTHLNQLLQNGRQELTAIAVDSEAARDRAMQTMATAAETVESYTATLDRGLTGLAGVLERLGDRTVIVETPARSWFGFGGRPNGRG